MKAENYQFIEWTDEKVGRFWDYESQFPQNYFTFQIGGALVNRFKGYFRGKTNLLDYGSGPGYLIKHLLKSGLKISALEFSEQSLNKLRKQYEDAHDFEGAFSIDEISRNNLQYDVITLIEVIEHLDDNYLNLTFENIKRLLKKDGYLIITTPNDEDLSKSYVYCPESNKVFHRWQHVRSWNKSSLKEFVEKSGFQIVEINDTILSFGKLRHAIKIFSMELKSMAPGRKAKVKYPHLYCVCKIK
jgi:2-polyprenyl-3-methyl-5-hydroxy-6-metoxy-1,4-benzoquinol methylase